MKRNLVYIVLSLALAVSLCGCANTMGNDGISVTSTPSATSSPKVSPKAEDGEVNDTDGIIGDNDRAENNNGTSSTSRPSSNVDETDGAKVNTQPKGNSGNGGSSGSSGNGGNGGSSGSSGNGGNGGSSGNGGNGGSSGNGGNGGNGGNSGNGTATPSATVNP